MKNKETIEDFIKEYQKDKTYWTINEKDNEASNIKIGAKWQAERSYSEEELRGIAEASFSFYRTDEFSDDELEVEWKKWLEKRIEMIKKK